MITTLQIGRDYKTDMTALMSAEVHEALRALWDLMEFYIWYPTLDTARAIKENNPDLMGDKITGAIAKRYLTDDVKSAIKAQLDYWQDRQISEPYTMNDDVIRWSFNGIPIELKILKRRYNFFEYFDPVTYNYDDYKLANPWSKYWTARFIVQ